MAASTDQVDRRFINQYIIRNARQHNIRFGFQNDMFLTNNRRIGDSLDLSDKMFQSSELPLEFI